MTLILNNDEVEKLLTMEDCLEVLEEAFKDLGRGVAVNQVRVHTYVPMEQSAISYRPPETLIARRKGYRLLGGSGLDRF